jgi:hypothetical protein
VVGVDVDFVEVSRAGLDYFDLREPDRHIIGKSNPEITAVLGVLEVFLAGCFRQDGFWRVAREEPGRGEFYSGQEMKIARTRGGNSVHSIERFRPRDHGSGALRESSMPTIGDRFSRTLRI